MSNTPHSPDASRSPAGSTRRHSTRTLIAVAATTAAVVVVIIGATLLLNRGGDDSDAAASASTTTTSAVPAVPAPATSESVAPSTVPATNSTAATDTVPADTVQVDTVDPAPANTEPAADVASPASAEPQRRGSVGTVGVLSTDAADIVDADGNDVTIRGVNWFGFETQVGAPHGLWSRNLDEMIAQIAGLGFNTIRLPFSAAMVDPVFVPNGINYGENPDLEGLTSLEVMDRVIDAAGAADLDVILDRHALSPDDRHHLWYDDQFPQERLVSDWLFLVERYGDRENVIGADLYNEPHDEACWGCGDPSVDWRLAAEGAGNAIHEIDADWLIFVEGVEHPDGTSCDGADTTGCGWWGGQLAEAGDEPVELTVPDKVVYSPHEYATSVFDQPWFDDPSFPANMPAIWDEQWGYLEREGIAPVMVGELGTTLESETDAIWLEMLLAYLDDIGAGFTFWSFNPNSGDTGGILQDDWITVDDAKMAYLEPYLN